MFVFTISLWFLDTGRTQKRNSFPEGERISSPYKTQVQLLFRKTLSVVSVTNLWTPGRGKGCERRLFLGQNFLTGVKTLFIGCTLDGFSLVLFIFPFFVFYLSSFCLIYDLLNTILHPL